MRTVDFGEVQDGGEVRGARVYVVDVLHTRAAHQCCRVGLRWRKGDVQLREQRAVPDCGVR